jgi:hypothetical protein
VSFYGVNSPQTHQASLKQYPKAQLIQKDNYRGFIHFVVSSKKKAEEKYSDLNIWNDSTIAHYFFQL